MGAEPALEDSIDPTEALLEQIVDAMDVPDDKLDLVRQRIAGEVEFYQGERPEIDHVLLTFVPPYERDGTRDCIANFMDIFLVQGLPENLKCMVMVGTGLSDQEGIHIFILLLKALIRL